jgi:hypothetical protein
MWWHTVSPLAAASVESVVFFFGGMFDVGDYMDVDGQRCAFEQVEKCEICEQQFYVKEYER